MFDQLVKRSDAVWIYSTGRFAEERRTFLCDLIERGYGWYTLRQNNKFLLDIAEQDAKPTARKDMSDAGTHGPGANDGHCPNLVHDETLRDPTGV